MSQKPFGLESYSDQIELQKTLIALFEKGHKSLSAWSPIRTLSRGNGTAVFPESQKPFGLESYSDHPFGPSSFERRELWSQKPFGLESYSDIKRESIVSSRYWRHKSLSAWSPIRTIKEYGLYS